MEEKRIGAVPHVYITFFETNKQDMPENGGTASDDMAHEKKRWDRREHEAGRRLLCAGLDELCGIRVTPEDLPAMLAETGHGKPCLKDHPDIHFNISHCRGAAACVFAEVPVGIDVENVRPVTEALIRRVLHEKEQETLAYCREEDGEEAAQRLFIRYWTLKESYLKQSGEGITREMAGIVFDLDLDDSYLPILCSDPSVFCWQQETRMGQQLALCLPKNGESPVEFTPRPFFREI